MRNSSTRLTTTLLLCLICTSILQAQSVTLPPEVKGDPGSWIVIVPTAKDGGEVKWKVGKGLELVPLDKLFPGQKSAGIVVTGRAGVYEVWAWNAKGDVASEIAVCKINIGNSPDPGPIPPGPIPPGPQPDPTLGGKWVIMAWESDQTLTKGQSSVSTSTKLRQYFRTVLKKEGGLKDGEFIMWDKDTKADGYPKEWQERWPKYRDKMKEKGKPMLFVSNGKTLLEMEIPDDVDKALETIKKHMESPTSSKFVPTEGKVTH